jgi:hypothetical protein
MSEFTKAEMEEVAEAAANKAVTNTFRLLDVDIHDVDSVRGLRRGIEHVKVRAEDDDRKSDEVWTRRKRTAEEKFHDGLRNNAWKVVAGVVSALLFLVYNVFSEGLKSMFGASH